jgi:3-mercaptopropionate dioxygenase
MINLRQPDTQLAALASVVRGAVGERAGWAATARLVAAALERHLPSPRILTAEQRIGDPDTYKSEVLHSEPDGSFSIVALVWRSTGRALVSLRRDTE